MQKDIDIIIYGATGFTGQLCVKYFQSLNTGCELGYCRKRSREASKSSFR